MSPVSNPDSVSTGEPVMMTFWAHLVTEIGGGSHEERPCEGSVASVWDFNIVFAAASNLAPE